MTLYLCTLVNKPKPLNFFIETAQRTYNLRAPSEILRRIWLSVLSVFDGAALQATKAIPMTPVFACAALSCIDHLLIHGMLLS